MRAAVLALCVASLVLAQGDVGRDLDGVARVASVMVDGDVARRIQTARSIASMMEKNPKDQWAASDNYDVNHAEFTATKKTLMRLARLCPIECDVNLWMPVEATPARIQVVIRNVHEFSQFWTWGALHQEMPAEMGEVLKTGTRKTVRRRAGMISVLAPVKDSLGDLVGVLEVVAQLPESPERHAIPAAVK
jgi:hypothetical protein